MSCFCILKRTHFWYIVKRILFSLETRLLKRLDTLRGIALCRLPHHNILGRHNPGYIPMSLLLLRRLNRFLPTTCFSVAVLCADFELFASHKVSIRKWSVTVLSSVTQVLVLAGIKGTVTQCSSLPKASTESAVANADSVHRGVFLVPCYLTMENDTTTQVLSERYSQYAYIHLYSNKATVTRLLLPLGARVERPVSVQGETIAQSDQSRRRRDNFPLGLLKYTVIARITYDKTAVESLLESGQQRD